MSAPLGDTRRIRALERSGMADATDQPALEALADLARDLLDVPVVLVSMVDDHRQVFKAAPGLQAPWSVRRQTGLSHSFCQRVATTAEPLVIEDAREDPRVRGNLAIDDIGVIAYAGMPIHGPDGHVLGSFCAIDGHARAWAERELVMLRRFADLAERIIAGQAPEAADPRGDGMVEDLRFARRLQRALLPAPAAGRLATRVQSAYQPGSDRLLLGGDFIDVLEHPDGSVGFVLGDVCGHGPESAAFAISLRAGWATLEHGRPELGQLMAYLNATAVSSQAGDDLLFATVLVGRMSATGAEVTIASAGHAPPVLLGRAVAEADLLGGMAVGVAPGGSWPATTLELPAGGALLFTDGLVEGLADGRGTSRRRWGTGSLLAALEHHRDAGAWGEELLGLLVRDATRAHGDELPDDVALLRIHPAR